MLNRCNVYMLLCAVILNNINTNCKYVWGIEHAACRNRGDVRTTWQHCYHITHLCVYVICCCTYDGAAKLTDSTLGFPVVPKPFEVAVLLFVTRPNITNVRFFFLFLSCFLLLLYVLCIPFLSMFFPFFLGYSLFPAFSYFLFLIRSVLTEHRPIG